MKITPNTKTLAGLFQPDSDTSYNVPVYQRNFSWKEEQIEILFNDIIQEDKGYYVGNLLIYTSENSNNIIDGQQRLTTLSLLLLGVYENLLKFEKDENIEVTQKKKIFANLSDISRFLLINDEEVRLKLLDNDKNVWENLTLILHEKEQGGWKRYTLFKRYEYVRDQLIGKIEDLETLLNFLSKLKNVVLLEISVPDLSDSYQVFASLNSKGLPLTPLDLLKNIYLSKGGDVSKWSELKSLFEKEDEVDEVKLRQFVLNNYDALENYVNAQSLTKGKIVKSYEVLFKNHGAKYIDVLIKRAKLFNKISNKEAAYDRSLSGLAKLDATTSYPLLLNLLVNVDKYELEEDHLNDIYWFLIVLYVRRNISLVPKASNLRHDLISMKNYIHHNNLKGIEIVEYLKDRIRKVMPKDNIVLSALEEGLYDKNKSTTRYILINLERSKEVYFNKAIQDSLDEFTKSNGTLLWSIEHIMPQGKNLLAHWKDVISPDDREKAIEIRDQYVHLLGNLTLTPYNSELGNKPFVKKLNYKDNGKLVGLSLGLYLNKSIDNNKTEWSINDIIERNKILSKEVVNLFKL